MEENVYCCNQVANTIFEVTSFDLLTWALFFKILWRIYTVQALHLTRAQFYIGKMWRNSQIIICLLKRIFCKMVHELVSFEIFLVEFFASSQNISLTNTPSTFKIFDLFLNKIFAICSNICSINVGLQSCSHQQNVDRFTLTHPLSTPCSATSYSTFCKFCAHGVCSFTATNVTCVEIGAIHTFFRC